jgi:hypothetical protein
MGRGLKMAAITQLLKNKILQCHAERSEASIVQYAKLSNRAFFPTHAVFDFQGVKACQSEHVEDSRGRAFARYASTGSA